MSGIQERLQLSRTPLDTWSKREQLCLASAVSCSGDQNWISVSRTLKTVCGGNGNNNNRPADWYSQKNCAVQYGHMLESVETTKRKKRSSESSVSSPATVEPPTELLLRRLTEERLQEIKAQMRIDQEMYRKIQLEIETLQSDEMTEQELQTMWQEIEKTQEAKRIEEMTMENRLREREQRKKELALNWRQSKRSTPTTPDTNTTSVDMEVEQQTPSAPAAPSPLLTSLLSTTSAGGTSSSVTAPANVSVARTTAPTITSLLTSGPTSISNQPAIKGDPALMARPISGPPGSESLTPSTPTTPGKSPSQAAPTLSMLLEQKNKNASTAKGTNDAKTSIGDSVNLETVPPAPATAAVAPEAGGDETDPNDEQLLEVFQNIMMNDIDIAMASAIEDEILKNVEDVDVASPTNNTKADEVIDFEDKLDALKREQPNPVKKLDEVKPVEVVIGSSDDSNDNVPLATVATHSSESKDRDQAIGETKPKESIDSTKEPLISEIGADEINETITLISSSSEDTTDVPTAPTEPATEDTSITESKKGEENDQMEKEKEAGESPDTGTTIIGTENGIEEEAARQDTPQPPTEVVKLSEDKVASGTDEESSALTDGSKPDAKVNKQPTINKSFSLEEQSKADVVETNPPQPPSAPAVRAPLLRKLPHRDRSESPMVDDDTTTASDHSTARSSTRRRCSSTPVIDSIPNSPASSEHNPHDDRRETRAASRKLFQTICSTLFESKHSSPFRRPFHDEHAQRYAELCLRPMDLPSIKRNIESGVIRNINELHRDVLLMTQNVLLTYKPHTTQHKTALLFWKDCQAIKEFAAQQIETLATTPTPNSVSSSSSSNTTATSSSSSSSKTDKDKDKSSANKARSGSRKSQRHH